jgi:hypothetical protein
LFDNLKEAPWLRALTPSEGLRGLDPLPERQLEPAIATATPETTTFYTEHLAPARTVIQSYADVAIEEDARVRRLQHNLLVAQSYMNRDASTATNYADSSREEAQAELDKIRIIGVADVTLTSSRGKFQLVLANGTDSTVDIEIEFDSEQLEFDPELLERLSTTYSPGNHPLTITATARASGKFPLTVRVNSPGSDYEIERKDINIRSTAYNNIALGITVGALMFLILFYLVRGLRRRTRAKGSPEADPA